MDTKNDVEYDPNLVSIRLCRGHNKSYYKPTLNHFVEDKPKIDHVWVDELAEIEAGCFAAAKKKCMAGILEVIQEAKRLGYIVTYDAQTTDMLIDHLESMFTIEESVQQESLKGITDNQSWKKPKRNIKRGKQ